MIARDGCGSTREKLEKVALRLARVRQKREGMGLAGQVIKSFIDIAP
jgi:hypothetical protein